MALAEMNKLDGLRVGDAKRERIYKHYTTKTGNVEAPLFSQKWYLCCHHDTGSG